MKRLIYLLLICSLISTPAMAQQNTKQSPLKRQSLLLTLDYPEVYKPARIILGRENKFTIKAEPGSYVSLASSTSNSGAQKFYGQILRLGTDITTKEGMVPENGILELNIEVPNDKTLDGKTLYIEVAVWKNKNLNDLRLAKVMSSTGRETEFNGIPISLPPKNINGPSFAPAIPGFSPEMMRAADAIDKIKKGEDSKEYYDNLTPDDTPAMLKNLRSPELKK